MDHGDLRAMRAIQRCQICRAEYYDVPICVHSMDEWDRYLDMDGFAAPRLSRRERRLQAKAAAGQMSAPDPFNRKQVEAVCRAVCKVDGIDPDDEAESCDDPAWTRYADAVAEALASSSLTSNNRGTE